ncbi:MAG: methionyl-tRNA formyltransferase [Ruminococcaceae bacterium]|nr:methionyl-tRNA formyltransferase [Oscillospiraceae bacterium]
MKSKILFMGTPDFADTSLRALIEAGADVIGVVTQPDKPKGRKMILTPPPVKETATAHNIPVYQPKTLRGDEFAAQLEQINPDMIVVAAFGKILPQNVLDYPKMGCICVHGSLLPKYRGAAPMQRAIIDGERETGITIMYMDAGIDTGDMIAKAVVPIELHDDFESVHDKMAEAGAKLLLETIEAMEAGTATREKQDDLKSTYAAKIENADCVLDFDADAMAVYNRIRGLSPFPLTVVEHRGRALKIVSAELCDTVKEHRNPGEVLKCDAAANRIEVACRTGAIAITGLLPEGKSRMRAADFINGRKIEAGDRLVKFTR